MWKAFPTLDAMKAATVEELAQVESMNQVSAEAVYNFFRMSKVEKQEVLK